MLVVSGDMTGVTGDPAGGMGALDGTYGESAEGMALDGALGGEPAGGYTTSMDDPMAGAMDGALAQQDTVLLLAQLLIQVNKDLPWIHLQISKMIHHQLKVQMI